MKPTAPDPSGPTLSIDQFCTLTGYSDQQLKNIARAGYYPPPDRGKWQTNKCVPGLIKYLRDQIAKKSDTLKQEQEAYTKAKREMAQAELAVFQGDHVPKAEIGPALRNIGNRQRSVLIHKLERELAPKLEGKTPLERLALIKAAVDDVCLIFAEGTGKWREGK